jgi:hypothetical protein
MNFTPEERSRILDAKEKIHKYIEFKFQELAPHEGAKSLEYWIRDSFVVAGGISASIFTGTAVKDIDLYHRAAPVEAINNSLQVNFLAEDAPWRHLIKDINPAYMVGEVNGKLVTANAITLINDMQLIRLGAVEDCRKIFDFKHCLPVYDIKNKLYQISRNEFDSLTTKKLMTHSGTPKSHRLDKFLNRGWRI